MMRLVIDNTNSARLPSHAQTGSGVSSSAPLPTHCGDRGNGPVAKIGRATYEESTSRGPVTIPCPELPAGADGHRSIHRAAARATGQGLKRPFVDAQAACAVAFYSPWSVQREHLP